MAGLQVYRNGARMCAAEAVVDGSVQLLLRLPGRHADQLPSPAAISDFDAPSLMVFGSGEWGDDPLAEWLDEPLRVGDELVVRVVAEGPFDAPQRGPTEADLDEAERLAWEAAVVAGEPLPTCGWCQRHDLPTHRLVRSMAHPDVGICPDCAKAVAGLAV